VGEGYYMFVSRRSGKCLDVPQVPERNGVQLEQRTCDNRSAAQAFRLWRQ
jgi:hypothetical protein